MIIIESNQPTLAVNISALPLELRTQIAPWINWIIILGNISICINSEYEDGDDGGDGNVDHDLATSICVRYSRDLFVDCIKLSGRVQCAEDIFSNNRSKGRLLASVLR